MFHSPIVVASSCCFSPLQPLPGIINHGLSLRSGVARGVLDAKTQTQPHSGTPRIPPQHQLTSNRCRLRANRRPLTIRHRRLTTNRRNADHQPEAVRGAERNATFLKSSRGRDCASGGRGRKEVLKSGCKRTDPGLQKPLLAGTKWSESCWGPPPIHKGGRGTGPLRSSASLALGAAPG